MSRRRRRRTSALRAHATAPGVIAEIVALSAEGSKQTAIAAAVGVSQAHVSRVLTAHRASLG